jgi:hypothetical protein
MESPTYFHNGRNVGTPGGNFHGARSQAGRKTVGNRRTGLC